MKKISLLLVLFITGFAFTACSSDDDSASPEEAVAGVWDAKSYHFIRYRDGETVSEVKTVYDENNVVEMRFREDGTFVHYFREGNGTEEGTYTGTYSLDGGEIILVYKGDSDSEDVVRVAYTISGGTLTTVEDEVDAEGGSVYREVTTMKYDKM
ncbi:lipocalin family protein [Sinomicrobium weinanense]|uniref:Lipocalin family protein n=1 Tax=Sinomicrobium weinanense TaxID=2842200 RepID=A0A926Q461_9FLAO|nr:lipocalin family protein [Sinomicrobium weinanense]MBC9796736.1 lipocalin family protein [Sinomicrobium weinanense]MBU3124007.1 lipocalin family protein [Sinomicrobium weinanense]